MRDNTSNYYSLHFHNYSCLLASWRNVICGTNSLDMIRNLTESNDALTFPHLSSTIPFEYLGTPLSPHVTHTHTPLYPCLCVSIWEGGMLAPQAVVFEMWSTPYCGANCDCYPMPRLSASVQITSSTGSRHLVGSSLGSFSDLERLQKTVPVSFTALSGFSLSCSLY